MNKATHTRHCSNCHHSSHHRFSRTHFIRSPSNRSCHAIRCTPARQTLATLLTTASLAWLALSNAYAEEFEDTLLPVIDEHAELPLVLSANRLKSPQKDAPAAVTVIEANQIEALGIRKLPDVFRLVPGMQVGYERGHQAAVSYHGLAEEEARRLQVLIDGRSVYQPALARILWSDLPLAVEDIARIEVIRSPASAVYGANSFLAVINIITKQPTDQLGFSAHTRHGSNGVSDQRLRYATHNGDLANRFTLQRYSDDGFDSRDAAGAEERLDDSERVLLNWDSVWQSSDNTRWRLQLGYQEGEREIGLLEPFEAAPSHDINSRAHFSQLTWDHQLNDQHSLKIQGYYSRNDLDEDWLTCPPAIFLSEELGDLFTLAPEYTETLLGALETGQPLPAPPSPEIASQTLAVINRLQNNGLQPSCGFANQDVLEERIDIEFQDTLTLSESLRLVSGISARRDSAKVESFLGPDELTNELFRIFANAEWRFAERWLLNAGAMWEHDDIVGSEFSPRLALNHHFTANHTFRAVIATATRTPDLYEEFGDRSYPLRHVSPPVNGDSPLARYYQSAQSNGGLESERILSTSLGWYAYFPESQLEWDVKLYRDSLTDLIEGETSIDHFHLENSGELTLHGIEGQLAYNPVNQWGVRTTLAYIEHDAPEDSFYDRSMPTYSASLAGHYVWPEDWKLGGAFYYTSDFYKQSLRRLDLRLAKDWHLSRKLDLRTELVINHRFDDNYLFDTRNYWDENTCFFVQFTLNHH